MSRNAERAMRLPAERTLYESPPHVIKGTGDPAVDGAVYRLLVREEDGRFVVYQVDYDEADLPWNATPIRRFDDLGKAVDYCDRSPDFLRFPG